LIENNVFLPTLKLRLAISIAKGRGFRKAITLRGEEKQMNAQRPMMNKKEDQMTLDQGPKQTTVFIHSN
jgi:hypothetical protein